MGYRDNMNGKRVDPPALPPSKPPVIPAAMSVDPQDRPPEQKPKWVAFQVVTKYVFWQWVVLGVTCVASLVSAVCAWQAASWAKTCAEVQAAQRR